MRCVVAWLEIFATNVMRRRNVRTFFCSHHEDINVINKKFLSIHYDILKKSFSFAKKDIHYLSFN
jgi:hypothetical protein